MSKASMPSWEDPCGPWSRIFARKNVWRCHGQLDVDDLIQEFWLVFHRVDERYADATKTPKHLMALFMTSCSRRMIDIAKQCSRKKASNTLLLVGDEEEESGYPAIDPRDHVRATDLRLDLKSSYRLRFLNRNLEKPYRPRRPLHYSDGRRETTGEFLCRVAGIRYTPRLREELETLTRNDL